MKQTKFKDRYERVKVLWMACCLLLLWPSFSFAEDDTAPVPEVSLDQTKVSVPADDASAKTDLDALPVELTADRGEFDQQKGQATYFGNVVVVQGQRKINADKIVIHLTAEQALDRIVATGAPVELHDVTEAGETIYGKGNNLTYFSEANLIVLKGNAFLKKQQDTMTGNEIRYDLIKEKVEGTRVKMVISPKTVETKD